MKNQALLRQYLSFVFIAIILHFLLRSYELVMLTFHFKFMFEWLIAELIGFCNDVMKIGILSLIIFPIYRQQIVNFKSTYWVGTIFTFYIISHVLILQYFFNQLSPLDTFLYQYPLEEISFTLSSVEINYWLITIPIIGLTVLSIGLLKIWKTKEFPLVGYGVILVISLVSIFLPNVEKTEGFTLNKSTYFYQKTFTFLLNLNQENSEQTRAYLYTHDFFDEEYPLLHHLDTTDVLTPYFHTFEQKPNIVFLMVEGLNDDYINDYYGHTFIPFLDSLKQHSLYWNHCLTLGERSFAVVPSLLGSLPHAQKGFMMQKKLPRHLSLMKVLEQNNYRSTFFYGQGSWFHRKNRFFNYNDIDDILDKDQFDQKYEKIVVGDDHFFWGYNDKELFQQSFEYLDTLSINQPQFNLYFTGTSHSPFKITNEEWYTQKMQKIIQKASTTEQKDVFETYQKYLQSVLFVNDALEKFFKEYQKKSTFENTIFVITGDHQMSETPIANSLKKYHVPLLIYSPKLKKNEQFSNVVTHWDVYETLLPFLKNQGLKTPKISTAIGSKLIKEDDSKVVFMNDNRELVDYYADGYFLHKEKLFKVGEEFSLTRIDAPQKQMQMKRKLDQFRKMNGYITTQDKLISDSLFCTTLNYQWYGTLKEEKDTLKEEFVSVFPSVKLNEEKTLVYEFSFDYEGDVEGTTIVYELKNEKGEVVLWKNMGLSSDESYCNAHFVIPLQNYDAQELYFKSYFWNTKKKEITISNKNTLLYGKK